MLFILSGIFWRLVVYGKTAARLGPLVAFWMASLGETWAVAESFSKKNRDGAKMTTVSLRGPRAGPMVRYTHWFSNVFNIRVDFILLKYSKKIYIYIYTCWLAAHP